MSRELLAECLRDQAPTLRERFGVTRLAIFGSLAKGDATADSDLDVLVSFSGPVGFDRFMELRFHLEDLLGVRVDLVTERALGPELRKAIEDEAIRVA